jgi:adenosylcobinamide kinase / adenosylcobinamide-phosphate guanylyltransferase
MALTLLLGGARSGKSRLAVRLAEAADRPVLVIATAEPLDEDMAERIRRHRAQRPSTWATVEEPVEVEAALAAVPEDTYVLIDCLTLWVANLMERGWRSAAVRDRAITAADLAAGRTSGTVVVSNEVGSGIVPVNTLAREYRDVLGLVNSIWAERADHAALVVAGRPLQLSDADALEGWS